MNAIERAGYLAHARTRSYQQKLQEASALLTRHTDYAVSVSWGKDSVVLLHLAAQILPTVMAVNARYPHPAERFPDMDRVRDECLARPDMQNVQYREAHTPGEWEMYERVGYGFASFETPQERAAARWWKECFESAMRETAAAMGATGHLLGLCAEESRGRRLNVKSRGQSYVKRNGEAIALPLSWWTGKDIWTYLISHDLPWLLIYDHARCGRERARSGFVFATAGQQDLESMGVWADWQQVYPDAFQAWMERWFPIR